MPYRPGWPKFLYIQLAWVLSIIFFYLSEKNIGYVLIIFSHECSCYKTSGRKRHWKNIYLKNILILISSISIKPSIILYMPYIRKTSFIYTTHTFTIVWISILFLYKNCSVENPSQLFAFSSAVN